jgi:3-oxoacyl-[acyl-carrier protein] reductase
MENSTIVISGANGNIGSYFAKKYIEKNRLLLITHQKNDRSKALEKYENVKIIKADITNFTQLKNVIDKIFTDNKWHPTSLIHTASVRSSDFSSLKDSNPDKWLQVIMVNVLGTYHLVKSLLPYYEKTNFGRILLFGSNVSRIGLRNGSAYAASKAAIANLCRSVAMELSGKNIFINTLSPGPIEIDDSNFTEDYRQFRKAYYEKEKEQIPLQRIARLDDLFEISDYLISAKNTYLTGEEIFLTGGKL